MAIVTAEDIKNETGIDLSVKLGIEPRYVNRWLERQQRHIVNYIARYAWGGLAQAQTYLSDQHGAGVIREALIEHVVFLNANNFIDSNDFADKDVADRTREIAPLAHDILANNGLLYTGRWDI